MFSVMFYSPYSETQVRDSAIDEELILVTNYSTFFPGGLYGDAQLIVPLLGGTTTKLKGRDRVVIRENLSIVWEGEIDEVLYSFYDNGNKAILTVNCIGHWGGLLKREGIDCKYCDMNIADSWQEMTTVSAYEKCNHTKPRGALVLKPKKVEWADGEYARWGYTATPVDQVVGRFSCVQTFEQASDWLDIQVYDGTGDGFFNRTTAETAAAHDNDVATPDNKVFIAMIQNSGSPQTMEADGTFKMTMWNIKVYAFASTDTYVPEVYLENICKHCISEVSNLNSDTTKIDTPSTSFAIEPFTTNNWEDWASILTRAASYGDGETTPTERYVRLEASDTATTPDGKPVLASRAFPTLTETDYRIRTGEDVLQSKLELNRDFGAIVNYVTVTYEDQDGVNKTMTPVDQTSLTDSESIAKWGTYKKNYDVGKATVALALQYGRRKLARFKNPPWIVKSNIVVKGHIRKSGVSIEKASKIVSGKRIKLENILSDMSSSGEVGTGLTFYITSTSYNPDTDECSIGVGVADDAAALLAQIKLAYS